MAEKTPISPVKNPMHSIQRQRSSSQGATPRSTTYDDNDDDTPLQQGSTHWAAASALAPISYGENSLLQDIEKRESVEESATAIQTRGRSGTRARSATVANELQIRTPGNRRATMDGMDRSLLFNDRASKFRQLFNFMESLVPRLQQRLNFYTSAFFIITVLSLARYYDNPRAWFGLYFTLVTIDLASAILDQVFFLYFIDKIFINHFDIAYLLHGFNGPLGMLIAIFIVGAGLKNFTATKSVPNWDSLVSAVTIILLCICVKNWYSRRHYIHVLERRFSDKLFKLQSWTSLLSELATYHTKRASMTDASSTVSQSQATTSNSSAATSSNSNKPHASTSYLPGLEAFQRTFIDVFADLVEATSKYSDEFEDDIDVATKKRSGSVSSTTAGSKHALMPAIVTTKINAIWRSEIRKKRTFWELAARMSMNMGALMIYTYNGKVVIRRKFQAKAFGKSLYLHLSRGGKDLVTHEVLKKIFEAQVDPNASGRSDAKDSSSHQQVDGFEEDEDHEHQFGRHRDREYHAISMLNKNADTDNTTLLYETAIELFDPFRLGFITEEQCMAALCLVYKEQRFAASSLNDYGELHHSLRAVVDTIFWSVMVVFLQSFLQWNIAQYYLPFVTMILTVSFALSSTLGNMFLSMMFVFFMSPYEIGNKIHIGADPNTRITGFVKSVSLFYTIINTSFNETMKIPNHTLFNEKICNLSESGGCVYALDIHFPLCPDDASSQSKIDEFCDRLKTWVLVENKLDWQACMIYATGISAKENVMNLAVWATHRDNWQDNAKALVARTNLVRYMKVLQNEVGLSMVRLTENVQVISEPEDYYLHTHATKKHANNSNNATHHSNNSSTMPYPARPSAIHPAAASTTTATATAATTAASPTVRSPLQSPAAAQTTIPFVTSLQRTRSGSHHTTNTNTNTANANHNNKVSEDVVPTLFLPQQNRMQMSPSAATVNDLIHLNDEDNHPDLIVGQNNANNDDHSHHLPPRKT